VRDTAAAPRVYIETYGCQMNIADPQTVRAVMRQAGFSSADRAEDADVILLNTCAIRDTRRLSFNRMHRV
jgi:tRNA-2-methylthio-N6-dimethylallyladenosine synthase